MRLVTRLTLVLVVSLHGSFGDRAVARADVIDTDHRPSPPPQCPLGAQAARSSRGHGWGGCQASTCASDADCGALGPCREAALCVGPEIEDHGPREPGEAPRSYRIAPLACDSHGSCPGPYECRTELRCVGRPTPPPPTPSAPPAPPPPPAQGSSAPAPAAGGLCSSLGLGLIALAGSLATRRRRSR